MSIFFLNITYFLKESTHLKLHYSVMLLPIRYLLLFNYLKPVNLFRRQNLSGQLIYILVR